MNKFRWLLVTLLALTLLGASGISQASAAASAPSRDLLLESGSAVAPPTIEVLGGGSGSGSSDGDPDDIIEGNRVTALVAETTARTSVSTFVATLVSLKMGGVVLLLRLMLP